MNKKTIFAVTHGKKEKGSNPVLTSEGRAEIAAITSKIPPIQSIMLGTGARFGDTFDALDIPQDLSHIQVRYSPLLGSADSGVKGESGWDVTLAHGKEVPLNDYLGLVGTPGIDMWEFLRGAIDDGTLLITGRELIGALYGDTNAGKSATLYEITFDESGKGAITEVM